MGFIVLPPPTIFKGFVIGTAAAFFGLLLPVFYLVRTVRKRKERIRRSLPDALDLLVVCVEAGISLDAALLRVAKDMVYVHPELSRELLIVNRKTNAGVTREVALRGLWDRTGVEEVRSRVEHLRKHEVKARLTTHGLGRMSIYVDDPDGYHIEFTVPFENTEIGRREIEKRGLLGEAERQRPASN